MRYLRLAGQFARASFQAELAYRANWVVQLTYSLLNLATGVLGTMVLFGQVESINGWDLASTLALLGVYLIVTAARALCLGPSLEALAGMEGEIWTGQFDFTLLRPVNTQFVASLSRWHPFALLDMTLGVAVVAVAASQLSYTWTWTRLVLFLLALSGSVAILYAILLGLASLVFWNPGVLFTWVFDGVFQMARYPLGLYPGWLQMALTWVVPVGLITTVPSQALTGALSREMLAGTLVLALVLVASASALFRYGLRRYASASS